jgi:hypothetical protein
MTTRSLPTQRVLPRRQVRWTRLGAGMGYTSTEPKREQIRAAIEQMDWRDPERLRDVLDAAPLRLIVNSLFHSGRTWALVAAAVIALPDLPEQSHGFPRSLRLIGLESVDGERYVLLDLGYEVIDLRHDHPVTPAVAR